LSLSGEELAALCLEHPATAKAAHAPTHASRAAQTPNTARIPRIPRKLDRIT